MDYIVPDRLGWTFAPRYRHARARAEAAELGLSNTRFIAQDLAVLLTVDVFDAVVVFDAIHDQVHPDRVLANIHRALRTGGDLVMVDIRASSELE